jgi:hypothetical protein
MQENCDIATMKLMLPFEPKPSKHTLSYADKLLLLGSCFSDYIGMQLQRAKFQVLFNPTGILFDPISLSRHLEDYATCKQYAVDELFLYNELWQSWFHHSDFSSINQQHTLKHINDAIQLAHQQLLSSAFLFITLGTAYSYQLKKESTPVANCHKAPKEWFNKKLLSIEEITTALTYAITTIRKLNPSLQIVFTVSPVKHIRDGIVENNRSKARLIEAANQLAEVVEECSYFPAYELVTDVLRDYRFYAQDMAHPNQQAIEFVFEHFCQTYMNDNTKQLMDDVMQIVSAKSHRPLNPNTAAHQQFLKTFLDKTNSLGKILPMLHWDDEVHYFSTHPSTNQ